MHRYVARTHLITQPMNTLLVLQALLLCTGNFSSQFASGLFASRGIHGKISSQSRSDILRNQCGIV